MHIWFVFKGQRYYSGETDEELMKSSSRRAARPYRSRESSRISEQLREASSHQPGHHLIPLFSLSDYIWGKSFHKKKSRKKQIS